MVSKIVVAEFTITRELNTWKNIGQSKTVLEHIQLRHNENLEDNPNSKGDGVG